MAAVTFFPAFGYKWGQDGSVYAMDDTQYKAGWAFIGATPPSVEQFNKVGQIADEKANWLYGQVKAVTDAAGLTLSAGTLTTLRDSIGASAPGRLLRRLVYVRIAGVQNVIVNGAAATTTGASTYVPGAGATFAIVQALGGGGGGAGSGGAGAGNVSIGAGGSGGSYGMSRFTVATIGASQSVTVGLGGTAGSNVAGGAGGSTSFGSLLTAPGGTAGGLFNNQAPPTSNGNGVAPAAPTGANLLSVRGVVGLAAYAINTAVTAMFGGAGGGSIFTPPLPGPNGNVTGIGAENYGAGGTGSAVNQGGGTATGGAGAAGIVIVEEYA